MMQERIAAGVRGATGDGASILDPTRSITEGMVKEVELEGGCSTVTHLRCFACSI